MCSFYFTLLFAALLGLGHAQDWVNGYDGYLSFTCDGLPNYQKSISRIVSQHHNGAEDRLWAFECRALPPGAGINFMWTDYLNDMDKELNYRCNHGDAGPGVLIGMESYHDNGAEDRRWKFHCVQIQGQTVNENQCRDSGYVNDFDQYMDYSVPIGYYLVGAYSYHSNGAEDRRWRYISCAMSAI